MDYLFEQLTNISKAHAYDILSGYHKELGERYKNVRGALNDIQHELATLDSEEVINNPAAFIRRIGDICNNTLTKNRPL